MDYGWLSLIPPILAIVLSLVTKEVLLSLFISVFVGAFILADFNLFQGFADTLNTYVVGALTDGWNISILVFCLSIGGLIGILNKNGGTKGIANIVISKAKGIKSSLLTTWVMGVLIFFDDYANTLIVGNTMRGILDKLKVSREKLAFIVDSTAAPVSSIALVSTWVGMEIGLINDGLSNLGLDMGAYDVFLKTIPYRFYSLLALVFVLVLIFTGKDFGPMLKAEKRRIESESVDVIYGKSESTDDTEEIKNGKWYNAVIPMVFVIGMTVFGLYINGGGLEGASIRDAFGDADASVVLLWASFGGAIIALIMTKLQGIMTIGEIMSSWVDGLKSMVIAGLILVLAWSLGGVNGQLGTADFMVSKISGSVAPFLVPTIMFLSACVIAFSTGTSWGTNAIIMPIAIPLAVTMGGVELLVPTIGAVLTGAVFGDHCSPLSDTTIMSSMASGCNHIEHVKTQAPYALTIAAVAIIFGFIPAGLGLSPWISLIVGGAILFGIIKYKGVNPREN